MNNTNNNHKQSYGICLGASTITAVKVVKDTSLPGEIKINKVIYHPHDGSPKKGFNEIIAQLNIESTSPVLVTGRKFRKFINLSS